MQPLVGQNHLLAQSGIRRGRGLAGSASPYQVCSVGILGGLVLDVSVSKKDDLGQMERGAGVRKGKA